MSQGLVMLRGDCAKSLAAEDGSLSLMGPPGKQGTSFLHEKSAPSPALKPCRSFFHFPISGK